MGSGARRPGVAAAGEQQSGRGGVAQPEPQRRQREPRASAVSAASAPRAAAGGLVQCSPACMLGLARSCMCAGPAHVPPCRSRLRDLDFNGTCRDSMGGRAPPGGHMRVVERVAGERGRVQVGRGRRQARRAGRHRALHHLPPARPAQARPAPPGGPACPHGTTIQRTHTIALSLLPSHEARRCTASNLPRLPRLPRRPLPCCAGRGAPPGRPHQRPPARRARRRRRPAAPPAGAAPPRRRRRARRWPAARPPRAAPPGAARPSWACGQRRARRRRRRAAAARPRAPPAAPAARARAARPSRPRGRAPRAARACSARRLRARRSHAAGLAGMPNVHPGERAGRRPPAGAGAARHKASAPEQAAAARTRGMRGATSACRGRAVLPCVVVHGSRMGRARPLRLRQLQRGGDGGAHARRGGAPAAQHGRVPLAQQRAQQRRRVQRLRPPRARRGRPGLGVRLRRRRGRGRGLEGRLRAHGRSAAHAEEGGGWGSEKCPAQTRAAL